MSHRFLKVTWPTHWPDLEFGLRQALNEGLFTDVAVGIVGEGKVIRAHKIILAAGSTYFAQEFSVPKSRVTLPTGIRPEIFAHLVGLLYFGRVPVPDNDYLALVEAGKRLGVTGLDDVEVRDVLAHEVGGGAAAHEVTSTRVVTLADRGSHLESGLRRARDEILFSDVAVDLGGGEVIRGHKLILAAMSGFFEQKRHDNYIRMDARICPEIFGYLVELMYFGRVVVPRDDYPALEEVGRKLEVHGKTVGEVGVGEEPLDNEEVAILEDDPDRGEDEGEEEPASPFRSRRRPMVQTPEEVLIPNAKSGEDEEEGESVGSLPQVKNCTVSLRRQSPKLLSASASSSSRLAPSRPSRRPLSGPKDPTPSTTSGGSGGDKKIKNKEKNKEKIKEKKEMIKEKKKEEKIKAKKKEEKNKEKKKEEKNKEKSHKCGLCSYKTDRNYDLRKHFAAVHVKEMGFKCQYCSYKSSRADYITSHLNTVHLKERPHACTLCSFKTSQRKLLKVHVVTVHEKKDFICEICPYTTTIRQCFQRHINALHLMQKNHECTICPFVTSRPYMLRNHVRAIHKTAIDFTCKRCSYRSFSKYSIELHVAAKHKKSAATAAAAKHQSAVGNEASGGKEEERRRRGGRRYVK